MARERMRQLAGVQRGEQAALGVRQVIPALQVAQDVRGQRVVGHAGHDVHVAQAGVGVVGAARPPVLLLLLLRGIGVRRIIRGIVAVAVAVAGAVGRARGGGRAEGGGVVHVQRRVGQHGRDGGAAVRRELGGCSGGGGGWVGQRAGQLALPRADGTQGQHEQHDGVVHGPLDGRAGSSGREERAAVVGAGRRQLGVGGAGGAVGVAGGQLEGALALGGTVEGGRGGRGGGGGGGVRGGMGVGGGRAVGVHEVTHAEGEVGGAQEGMQDVHVVEVALVAGVHDGGVEVQGAAAVAAADLAVGRQTGAGVGAVDLEPGAPAGAAEVEQVVVARAGGADDGAERVGEVVWVLLVVVVVVVMAAGAAGAGGALAAAVGADGPAGLLELHDIVVVDAVGQQLLDGRPQQQLVRGGGVLDGDGQLIVVGLDLQVGSLLVVLVMVLLLDGVSGRGLQVSSSSSSSSSSSGGAAEQGVELLVLGGNELQHAVELVGGEVGVLEAVVDLLQAVEQDLRGALVPGAVNI
ncbi:hypothetical protein LOZ21_006904 [Ophidiomyces ophidiicola]|nr:hypothetical protein LOZ21_006904 [Ophidiomyces ophidiicola]